MSIQEINLTYIMAIPVGAARLLVFVLRAVWSSDKNKKI